MSLIADQTTDVYNGLMLNENVELLLKPSYLDYIANAEEYKSSDKFIKDKEYWENTFEVLPELATIMQYKTNGECPEAIRKEFSFKKKMCEDITNFCRENNISPYSFLMSVYSIYLSRVSNLNEVVIGTPLLNRSNFKEKNTTGMFVNTLPNKIKVNYDISFKEFIADVSKTQMSVFRHQKYPYDLLLEHLREKHKVSRGLYDVVLSYQNARNNSKISDVDYSTNWTFSKAIANSLDVHIYDLDDSGILNIFYDYQTYKFTEQDIISIHNRILHMINQVLHNDIYIKDIDIVTEEENRLLDTFNNTTMDLIDDNVINIINNKEYFNNDAVIYNNEVVKYKELLDRVDSLSRNLIMLGIKPKDNIGLLFKNKDINLIVSILAVLKVGACFLGIYQEYPNGRINYMIEDSNCKLLITDDMDRINTKIKKLNINELQEVNEEVTFPGVKSTDNAYIIYTSGSTGEPKGSILTHKNLINFVYSFYNRYSKDINADDSFISITNICFDVSICEIFVPLFFGASLFLYKDMHGSNISELCEYISNNRITFAYFPPSLLEDIALELKRINNTSLDKLLVGVEPIRYKTLSLFYNINSNMKIVNGYGPSETTICSTMYNVRKDNTEKEQIVPIGAPIGNTKIYILDNNQKKLPINVPGEIYITGDGVGQGYINQKKLNDEKFVKLLNGETAYRTGDIAKWLADGNIMFAGRQDNQIKFKGYRIDLGEIETNIIKYEGIKNAVVLLNENKMIGYIILDNKTIITEKEIKQFLSKFLPYYMIPNNFVFLDTIPLTPNGKIDKNRLLSESQKRFKNSREIVKPRNEIDKKLLEIFEETLENKTISIKDSVLDLGGDSLTIINICTLIYTRLSLKINVQEIQELQTIEKISDFLNTKDLIIKNNINIVKKQECYPITEQQKGIYLAAKKAGENSLIYNAPASVLFDDKIDVSRFIKVMETIVDRHPAFRTFFVLENNEIVQKIKDHVKLEIDVVEIEQEDIAQHKQEFIKPFNLEEAPLLRVKIIETELKTLVLLDMHHIISDGKSLQILLRDIEELYNGNKLEPLDLQYKDYAAWQVRNKSSRRKIEYDPLDINYDYNKKSIETYKGTTIFDLVDEEETNIINNLAKNLNVTPYMIFLSIYFILLSRYSNSEIITVSSASEGRENAELNDIIGMFVKDLIIKSKVEAKKSYNAFLNRLKKIVTDEIERSRKYTDSYSTKKIFDTMFLYVQNITKTICLDGVSGTGEIIVLNNTRFDFSMQVTQGKDNYKLELTYSTDLIKDETAKKLLGHYQNILSQVIENSDIKLQDIEIVTPAEKEKLLYEFNDTEVKYEENIPLHMLIERQAKRTPERIAIVFEDKHLTYRELDEYSNSLAHYLRKKGVTRNTIIGVMVNRSLEMIVGILGVLKAGGTYIPIDTEFPKERVAYMLQNSNSLFVLSQKILGNNFEDKSKTVFIDLDEAFYKENRGGINNISEPKDIIYLIYTSGSTGNPKGVTMTQQAVSNFTNYCNDTLEYLKSEDQKTIVSVTTVSFDIFVLEALISLQKGLKVIIANKDEQVIPKELNKLLEKYKVHAIQMTPSRMQILLDNINDIPNLKNITSIILAGEPFSDHLANSLRQITSARLYNGYGPSETTYVTLPDVTDQKNVTIGKPMYNTQIYILKNNKLCPTNVPGEIYIGGDNVGLRLY